MKKVFVVYCNERGEKMNTSIPWIERIYAKREDADDFVEKSNEIHPNYFCWVDTEEVL